MTESKKKLGQFWFTSKVAGNTEENARYKQYQPSHICSYLVE
jgi:hypothetical protein